MVVVDVGWAPGGWSQMVRESLRERGSDKGGVVELDILPVQGIGCVEFIEGDFRDEGVLRRLEEMLNGSAVDLVLSDMAPNISGVESVDQARAMELAELAQAFAAAHLKPGGAFLTKLFQGRGFDDYLRGLRADFGRVSIRKPKASRARSAEVYALATGRHGPDAVGS